MDNGSLSRKGTSFYIKRTIGLLLLLALSATFFYSAYTKSGIEFHNWRIARNDNSFDSFQWTFLDLGINSTIVAGVIARMLIGFELLLGLLLLFHVFLKSFTYKAVILVLSVFIIYLLLVILKQGNSGNCGCFGDKLAMKPLTAIWKNVIMIAVTAVLWFIYPVKPYRKQQYVFLLLCFVAFSLPFIVNNIYVGTNPEPLTRAINLEPLYKYTPAPSENLRKGKHIIAFMSLTCPHCKKAAYLLQIIHHQHPDIPVYMVLDGPESYEKAFFDETHAAGVPYIFYAHTDDFLSMAGTSVPAIYWVNNSVIEYKSTYAYYQLDPQYMEQWLKRK